MDAIAGQCHVNTSHERVDVSFQEVHTTNLHVFIVVVVIIVVIVVAVVIGEGTVALTIRAC